MPSWSTKGLTSGRQTLSLRPHRDRYGYHALASGASAGDAGLRRRQHGQPERGRWCVLLPATAARLYSIQAAVDRGRITSFRSTS